MSLPSDWVGRVIQEAERCSGKDRLVLSGRYAASLAAILRRYQNFREKRTQQNVRRRLRQKLKLTALQG